MSRAVFTVVSYGRNQPNRCSQRGGVGLRPVDEHLLGRRARRDVVRPHAREEGRVTAQRGRRAADAARVEAHDVVLAAHLRADPSGDEARERPARLAGAARVDEHDALLLGNRRGRRNHGQRERDLPARRGRRSSAAPASEAHARPASWPVHACQCSVDAWGTMAAVPAGRRGRAQRRGGPASGACPSRATASRPTCTRSGRPRPSAPRVEAMADVASARNRHGSILPHPMSRAGISNPTEPPS